MTDDEMIQAWREKFYEPWSRNQWLEEADFESVALGFFICLGTTPEEAWELYQKCIKLKVF